MLLLIVTHLVDDDCAREHQYSILVVCDLDPVSVAPCDPSLRDLTDYAAAAIECVFVIPEIALRNQCTFSTCD
jgi:hypothetical protein